MSPETVNTSGVVGQATSFDLTLTGDSLYTYTQTFGDICDVTINNDTATVTITPVTSGTLTGSITFDNQATCNITIDVSEPTPPTPTEGFEPSTVTYTMSAQETKTFDFTLGYNSTTEKAYYDYRQSIDDVEVSTSIDSTPNGCRVTISVDNSDEYSVTGVVYVTAQIADIVTEEILREYTARINLTIEGLEPEP